jgi:ABC-type transport system substrate-binding protein
MALREAGWTVEQTSAVFGGGPPVGLRIVTNSNTNQTAAILQRAFREIGLEVAGDINPNQVQVQLFVGVKP